MTDTPPLGLRIIQKKLIIITIIEIEDELKRLVIKCEGEVLDLVIRNRILEY